MTINKDQGGGADKESKATNSDDTRLRVLLAEYEQMWQSMRDDHHVTGRREALFVAISFGILAYTLGQNLSLLDLIAAASASILIFLYFLFGRERVAVAADLRAERVRKIETEMNKIAGEEAACYQTILKQRRESVRAVQDVRNIVGQASSFPFFQWLTFRFNVGKMNLVLLAVLILIWVFRILE